MTTGEKLKAAMEAAGTDEYRLARSMYVNPVVIISIINGKRNPDATEKRWIERNLNLPRHYLDEGEDEHAGNDAANHADG